MTQTTTPTPPAPEPDHSRARDDLLRDLARAFNVHCRENVSDTPDFLLAAVALAAVEAFEMAELSRRAWFREETTP